MKKCEVSDTKMDYPELPSEMAADKEKTFDQTWIESSYLETLLPSTPWQNVTIPSLKTTSFISFKVIVSYNVR